MSISWGVRPGTEKSGSNPDTYSIGYVLTGALTEPIARALAMAMSPVMASTLYRTAVALDHIGPDIWNVDVSYGTRDRKDPEPGDWKWSFSTGGATKHITQAIDTAHRYVPPGKVAVDHKGTIGLNENGDVDGVDVDEAQFEWTEDWQFLLADYGWTYAQLLAGMTNKYNDDTFRGFPAGSVRLKNATGGQSAKDGLLVSVSLTFVYSPNVAGKVVGDINGISKRGWDYLWVEYHTEQPGAGGLKLPKRPSQVNVEIVYDPGDFSTLGVGTSPLGS